jgi:4-hydroxybenzoate polyprenyltransferase
MHPMLAFYKQTWWLWLLFLGVFVALSYFVSPLFIVMIPGLILYSVYFGVVRTSELDESKKSPRR